MGCAASQFLARYGHCIAIQPAYTWGHRQYCAISKSMLLFISNIFSDLALWWNRENNLDCPTTSSQCWHWCRIWFQHIFQTQKDEILNPEQQTTKGWISVLVNTDTQTQILKFRITIDARILRIYAKKCWMSGFAKYRLSISKHAQHHSGWSIWKLTIARYL